MSFKFLGQRFPDFFAIGNGVFCALWVADRKGDLFLAGGVDGSGQRFTGALGGPLRSGTGARAKKDGIDVADHDLSNVFHIPLEVTEKEFPVRYRRMQLWTDSGGAGKCRGGLGFSAAVEWLEGEAVLSVRGERHKFHPWGLQGGLVSPVCRTEILHEDGSIEKVPAKIVQGIKGGQTLRYWSTGGGGYGSANGGVATTAIRHVRLLVVQHVFRQGMDARCRER